MLWRLQGWGQLDPVNTKQSEGKPQFQTGPTLTLLVLNCNSLTLFENIESCCWDSTLLKQTQRCWLQEQPPSCLHVDLFGSLGFWFKAGAPRHIHILMKALPACSLAMLAAALKTDWQPLCGSSDAAGDLMNERKRWRDLCLMPQRYLLSPPSVRQGKMQGLWHSNARPPTFLFAQMIYDIWNRVSKVISFVMHQSLWGWCPGRPVGLDGFLHVLIFSLVFFLSLLLLLVLRFDTLNQNQE